MCRAIGAVLLVWGMGLNAQKNITSSRQLSEAVESAFDKEEAASILLSGYKKFYFASPQDRTTVTRALKSFYRKYGVSPVKVLRDKEARMLRIQRDKNTATYEEFVAQEATLARIPAEIERAKKELAEYKKDYAALEAEYKKFVSNRDEDMASLLTEAQTFHTRLEKQKKELQQRLEKCR